MNRELAVRDLKDLRDNCHAAYTPAINDAIRSLEGDSPPPQQESATVADLRRWISCMPGERGSISIDYMRRLADALEASEQNARNLAGSVEKVRGLLQFSEKRARQIENEMVEKATENNRLKALIAELESRQAAPSREVDWEAMTCFVTVCNEDEIHVFQDYGDAVRFANNSEHRYIYSADKIVYHPATPESEEKSDGD